tara:strand:+ start:630 stop:887 length:258 start_codon:yes stop_codon:yes gene_type:complete
MGYNAKSLLTLTEEQVLRHRFGLTIEDERYKSLEEVGRIFGVTRERIRQLEAKAIDKLGINIPVRASAEDTVELIRTALSLYGAR